MRHDEPILRDLALVYLTLAHGADNDLDDLEMDLIAQRLHDVQADVPQGTVLQAVKEALEDYAEEDAAQRIGQAVDRLARSAPPDLRRRILKDLTDIGKADGRFLYAEAAFIGRLTEAWKSDLEDPVPVATWSIFSGLSEDAGWTPVHDLTLIYVTLAHRTDDVLSRTEVRAITEKIGEWMPDADEETLRRVLHDVLRVYQEQPEGRTFDDAVEAVRKAVPPHQRAAVLDDLRHIADADGVLLVEERLMIEALAQAWQA